jgi:hypothetical protein
MLWLDRAFVALLALGALGHFFGTLTLVEPGSALQVWSLSGVLCAALVVALNALRTVRPGDRAVAWMAGLGAAGWCVVALLFGRSLGNLFDFRVVWHALAAAGLAAFSLRTLSAK